MKQKIFIPFVLSCIIIFASCVKDAGKQTYTLFTPIIEETSALRAKIKTSSAKPVNNAGKLFVIGNYVYLNEIGKGIHIIDNSNKLNPTNLSFIEIPGNIDMAVKGNTLYADCYTDLITLNISNPLNAIIKNVIEDAFSDRRIVKGYSTEKGKVITSFLTKDTTIDVAISEGQGIWTNSGFIGNGNISGWFALGDRGQVFNLSGMPTAASSNSIGKAGSMSRFAIVNNYLYSVSNSSLSAINIENSENPSISNIQNIGWEIETIYPFKDKLFIGSTTGMQVFNVNNPSAPQFISSFAHARLCDPVIADDDYAYLTLHSSEDVCQGTQNELNVIDISNISSPQLITRINLTKPKGLSKDGNVLIVCDDNSGLRIFSVSNPTNPILVQTIALNDAYDVICDNGIAIVSAKDGIHQYNYTNPNNVVKISQFAY